MAEEQRTINEWFETLRHGKFSLHQRVRTKKGASWQGAICGFYSTPLNPIGYCVVSEREINSVHVYPESMLELVPEGK